MKFITNKQVKPVKQIKQAPPKRPVEYYSWVEGGKYISPTAQEYILPNNIEFPTWILDKYGQYQLSEAFEWNCNDVSGQENVTEEIFPYQEFVKEYMSYSTPYRGMLLYYGLGSGKTRAALEIARSYRENLGWNVIFISPAALVDNFVEEMGKWGIIPKAEADHITSLKTRTTRIDALGKFGYYMVSYDAPNKGAQLRQALETSDDPGTKPRIRNKVIIVDEVHNMAQFIHNGMNQSKDSAKKKRAQEFYDILYGATNCRFVFLSGTPMINVPSELSIIFNILRGPMRFRPQPDDVISRKQRLPKSVSQKTDYFSVFSTDQAEFDKDFIDWKTLKILPGRDDIFVQRILGLVAYYSGARGDVYPDLVNADGSIKGDKETPWTIVEVPMSDFQLDEYNTVRAEERTEPLVKKTIAKVSKQTTQSLSPAVEAEIRTALHDQNKNYTFRIKSRQVSNFALPIELRDLRPRSISAEPEQLQELYDEFEVLALALEKEDPAHIFSKENLPIYSPKMAAMLVQIERIKGTNHDGNILVYSNFRSIEGIEIFARILETNGYQWYDPEKPNPGPIKPGEESRFAILGKDYRTGGKDYTTKIIKIFNSDENKTGDIIKIVLGTSNISEGISLFNIRLVLIMEPHWNMVRINQVIGRARRICSHRKLSRNQWNFQVYIYLSIIPEDSNIPDEISTDQVLYEIAIRKETVKNQFVHLIKEAAVDCILNATHNRNLEQDPPIRCKTFPKVEDELVYSYFPDINDDLYRTPAVVGKQETVGWTPFLDIQHSKFIDPKTKLAKFAMIVDPNTGILQAVRAKIKDEGTEAPRPRGTIHVGRALYDRVQLEHAGEFVIKGYLLEGKPLWPLISPSDVDVVEEYFPK